VGVKDKALEAAQIANQSLTSRTLKADGDAHVLCRRMGYVHYGTTKIIIFSDDVRLSP
jgi:hypothetical protein